MILDNNLFKDFDAPATPVYKTLPEGRYTFRIIQDGTGFNDSLKLVLEVESGEFTGFRVFEFFDLSNDRARSRFCSLVRAANGNPVNDSAELIGLLLEADAYTYKKKDGSEWTSIKRFGPVSLMNKKETAKAAAALPPKSFGDIPF